MIAKLVRTLHEGLDIPVTCKIRVFPDLAKTIAYAKMIEASGCQMLTVHGRTIKQKGQLTGIADWEAIKAVKEAVSIPVVANGNILYEADVDECIRQTGVDGVMSAEANLTNPTLFSKEGQHHVWKITEEYFEIVKVPTLRFFPAHHPLSVLPLTPLTRALCMLGHYRNMTRRGGLSNHTCSRCGTHGWCPIRLLFAALWCLSKQEVPRDSHLLVRSFFPA